MPDSSGIGDRTEKYILEMMAKLNSVKFAERSLHNEKVDIYYRLTDGALRGLQVKHLGKKSGNSYGSNHLDRYSDGTLIICVNPEDRVGLIFVMSPEFRAKSITVTIGGTKGVFSRLLLDHGAFSVYLESMLPLAPVIENIRSLMTPCTVLEMESKQRFKDYCSKFGLRITEPDSSASVTDVIVSGFKCQLKYSSSPENRRRTYSHKVMLGRGNGPYIKGDNDFYVIELGGHHGEFLILHEQLLIDMGYVSHQGKGKQNLNVFPLGYIREKMKSVTSRWDMVKGNWTCDSKLWFRENNFITDYPHPYNKIGDGPEGPEVRVTADELDFLLANIKLLKVSVLGGKFAKTPPQGIDLLKYPLVFDNVSSKGKMLIFTFKETKMRMFAGLGMTAQFTHQKTEHSHLQFDLGDMPEPFPSTLYYTDPRRFGNVYFTEQDLSVKLAPGIFEIDEETMVSRSKKVNTKKDVLSVLMDQEKVVSGLGNYMVAETLYAAKVSPFRPFKQVTDDELRCICREGKRIALISYQSQGLSIQDFTLPDGRKGGFKPFLHVYTRGKTPANEPVKGEKGSHGRTIWWVPSVQK